MHEPDADLYAAIDRITFERLKQTNPVYEHDPDTVIVSPETFDKTPKRLPHTLTAEEQEQQRERRAAATAVSKVMHRKKKRKLPRN